MANEAIKRAIESALAQSGAIKGTAAANEANTKAVLIEPLMESLGWNTGDPNMVTREFKVFDGTFLDYALLIEAKPRLFVEAKALDKSLDDKALISQAINYANNEGVIWCILTNGMTYRVYKTNESVGMGDKLLFEVDLREAENGRLSEIAGRLEILSPKSIAEGLLDGWGQQVFADHRVRSALGSLADDPPKPLLEAIEDRLGTPKMDNDLLRASLRRVVAGDPMPPVAGLGQGQSNDSAGPRSGRRKATPAQEFPIDHHVEGKPAAIVDLFQQLDSFANSLGTDVSRRSRKHYVAYFAAKKSFFSMEVQKTRIWVYLGLDPTTASPWNPESMRDVRQIGHYGLGDTEYNLVDSSQVDEIKALVRQAYEARR